MTDRLAADGGAMPQTPFTCRVFFEGQQYLGTAEEVLQDNVIVRTNLLNDKGEIATTQIAVPHDKVYPVRVENVREPENKDSPTLPKGWSSDYPGPSQDGDLVRGTRPGGRASIEYHEGQKYLRKIYDSKGSGTFIHVDVYQIIEAYRITCPALQHALKKVLCCGNRGKGTAMEDLKGLLAAVNRAIDLQQQREQNG